MKPLSVLLIFLVIAIPLTVLNDARQKMSDFNREMHRQYADDFRSAVDDAGAYLARLEAQQTTRPVRYQEEKQLELDLDMLRVFYRNLALKFGFENNAAAIQNVMLHMPALVMFRYNGYVMVTLDDTAGADGERKLEPAVWPVRPYWYRLDSGNTLYFTLDDKATVYDKSTNSFYQGDYDTLAEATNLAPLTTIAKFREVRQRTVTLRVEQDLAAAINRHMELAKRMGLSVSFTLPQGVDEQSVKDVGFMAFIQGYPLPGGERLDAYAFAGSSVVLRETWTGTVSATGKHVAYGNGCTIPSGVVAVETLFDPEEAARKGYFLVDCD